MKIFVYVAVRKGYSLDFVDMGTASDFEFRSQALADQEESNPNLKGWCKTHPLLRIGRFELTEVRG